MLDGVILFWFVLTAMALLFVAIDIRTTSEITGPQMGLRAGDRLHRRVWRVPVRAGLWRSRYLGLHEQYTSARWRQTLGSTMHCVAGDGVGILVGAALAGVLHLSGWWEVILEYVLGFAFGWMIFQALFMSDMVGGSYSRSLTSTFIPELLSMNLLMAGMIPTMMLLELHLGGGHPAPRRVYVHHVDGAACRRDPPPIR